MAAPSARWRACAAPGGAPHPVQAAMAEHDGTQCGFCTPGIVMSAWAFAPAARAATHARGAGRQSLPLHRLSPDRRGHGQDGGRSPRAAPPRCRRERSRRASAAASSRPPRWPSCWRCAPRIPRPAAGRRHRSRPARRRSPRAAGRGHLPARTCRSCTAIVGRRGGITVGAAVPYARGCRSLIDGFPGAAALLARLGSRQIRGLGTLGGNLGTASPIGDMPPPLIALGASVTLASPRGARELPVEEFFTGYRKTALAPDEVIVEPARCRARGRARSSPARRSQAPRPGHRDGRPARYRCGSGTAWSRTRASAFGGMAATPARRAPRRR